MPLLERLGLPLSFLAIAIVAFVRGDIVPKYIHTRALSDLDRERRETDRFLDMCIRLLEDARDSQHVGQEAVQAMRAHRTRRGEQDDERKSILDRSAKREENEDALDEPRRVRRGRE